MDYDALISLPGDHRPPELVAHRGYAKHYPENTLESIAAALRVGARFVEFDIQITSDHEPVLFHDTTLERTAGVSGVIHDMSLSDLDDVFVNETERLGNRFTETRIPTLESVIDYLQGWPDVTAFVEIKRASLRRFGIEMVVERVMEVIEPLQQQCIVLSFDDDAVDLAAKRGARRIAWVIDEWNDRARERLEAMKPEFVFCNHKKIPNAPDPLWAGCWEWVLYEIVDPALAVEWSQRGAGYIETMAVGELLDHPLFYRNRWEREA